MKVGDKVVCVSVKGLLPELRTLIFKGEIYTITETKLITPSNRLGIKVKEIPPFKISSGIKINGRRLVYEWLASRRFTKVETDKKKLTTVLTKPKA